MTAIVALLPALYEALLERGEAPAAPDELRPLPTTGLAHDHVLIGDTGRLLRVPRQSQMRLDARANLAYQAACFQRCSAGGHAPRFYGMLEPSPDLPMGALIVEAIAGGVAKLPRDLGEIARALASIHALPLPSETERSPLRDDIDPISATLREVQDQADHLGAAGLPSGTERAVRAALAEAVAHADAQIAPVRATLISFDAHPGNFLVESTGAGSRRAVLVDLEKARYGGAGFDLAHATLYTSTTWDVATYSEPSHTEIAAFYATWLDAVPRDLSDALHRHLLPMRRLMWLWSVTWCAMWRVRSGHSIRAGKQHAADTEDWSAENSEAALIAHVRDRVDCYLDPEIVDLVQRDWTGDNELTALLRG